MKPVIIYSVDDLENADRNQTQIDNEWVSARPIGFTGIKHRIRCAWLAFTGQCDLVKWPKGQ